MAQELNAPTIPTHLGQRTHRGYNVKFIVGGLLPLALVAYLVFQMIEVTRTTGAYWMTVSELYAAETDILGQRVRVNGKVVEGSEDWNAQEVTLRFSISDENGDVLPIVYYDPRPDNFQRAAEAIVEGELLPDGTFHADMLLLKCPSRYDEEPSQIICQDGECVTIS